MLAGILVDSILAMVRLPWLESVFLSTPLMPYLLSVVSMVQFLVHRPCCHLCCHFSPPEGPRGVPHHGGQFGYSIFEKGLCQEVQCEGRGGD
jgi:hypothetical protein